MKATKIVSIISSVLVIMVLAFTTTGKFGVTSAKADGTIPWTGNGSQACPTGCHWVLAPAKDITGATLWVNGVSYTMTQSGQGSWSADSSGAFDPSGADVFVDFTGAGDTKNHLQLSHALEGDGGDGGDGGCEENCTPVVCEDPLANNIGDPLPWTYDENPPVV